MTINIVTIQSDKTDSWSLKILGFSNDNQQNSTEQTNLARNRRDKLAQFVNLFALFNPTT